MIRIKASGLHLVKLAPGKLMEAMMPDEVVHVVEDAFHRLQHPQAERSPSDEDLANAAQIAIWNCHPGLHGRAHVSASGACLTLTGTVDSEEQRKIIKAAALSVNGVQGVTDALEVIGKPRDGAPSPAMPSHQITAEPMLYVTRYCGIEPYSLNAALHEAAEALDRRFAQLGLPVSDDVVVVYRNRLPESVVLDVGYVLPKSVRVADDDEFKLGKTPGGKMLEAPAPIGSHHLFQTHDELVQRARLADLTPANYAWQRFPLNAARLRTDHLAAPLYLPVKPDRASNPNDASAA